MAIMGKARYPEEIHHQRVPMSSGGVNLSWSPSDTKDKKKEKDDTLKDAYVFMKSNKDNLNDPQVRDILTNMLDRAGISAVFKQKEVPTVSGQQLTGGYEGAVAGAGAGQLEMDPDKTIQALYQRFMMENPNVYKPETTEEMYQGTPSTVRRDPISGEVSAFGQIPKGYAPGTQIGEMVGEKFKVRHTVPTAAKETKSFNAPTYDPNLGYGQYDSEGQWHSIIKQTDIDKELNKEGLPNAVFNKILTEALNDAVKDSPGFFAKVKEKIVGTDRDAFFQRLAPYFNHYKELYQKEQGSRPSPASPQSPQPPTKKSLNEIFGK